MHYLRQADYETTRRKSTMRYGNAASPIEKAREKERRADEMNKERELRPKLGCNYSRLPCKLSSCHSYLLCRVQLR